MSEKIKAAWNEWSDGYFSHTRADDYRKFDWKQNPWAALPQWIGFSARKGGKAI